MQAARLELCVSDRQHFVNEQDVRLEVGSDGEAEPHVHAGRVPLHRRIDEPLNAGELDDAFELAGDFAPRHAQQGSAQEDVFAPRELRVKP